MEVEIRSEDFKKHISILGDREVFAIFGGRPEWDEEKGKYLIPKTSPRKMTEWVEKSALERVLTENIRRGWTTWISLNEKETGEDTIEGTSAIWCFWFDFDAPRADKSRVATEEERKKALEEAQKFKSFMEERGLRGFLACSGNGYHLFFPVNRFELRGRVFRKEFNEKQRLFYKRLREESGVEFDTTTDIRRVTQPIGYPNMKIPDMPVPTYWVDEFTEEDIKRARKKNEVLIDTVLNTEIKQPEPAVEIKQHMKFEELLERNERVKELYNGIWGKQYKSRSEAEMALVTILCANGFSDAEIKEIMRGCKIGKWQEKTESYYDLTIKKAREYVATHKIEEKKKEDKKKEREKLKDKEIKTVILNDLMERFIFVTADDNEDVYVYRDGIYVPGEKLIKAETEKIIGDEASTYLITEIINHIRRRTYVPRSLFNKDKNYLPVKNGLLNLKDFTLHPFDPSKIYTYQLPVEYDAEADCPNIKKFINEIVREEDKPILQEFLGYCLYPDMPAHKSLWLYGTGRNGKTTFVNLLRILLGDICTVSVSIEELDGSHRFSKARLFGKLVNIISEPSAQNKMETVEFKKLTGGDLVSAEVKNKQNTIDFVNFAKFIILGNKFPEVQDATTAFWERVIVIEFPNQFIDNAIPNYEQVLVEKDGIAGFLNWCLEGLKRLEARGFKFSESKTSKQKKAEFMRMSNSARAFIEERCELDPNAYISKGELYDCYKLFCEREGLTIVGKKRFSEIVGEIPRVYAKHKKIGGKIQRAWFGIRVKEEEEEDEEQEEDKEKKKTRYVNIKDLDADGNIKTEKAKDEEVKFHSPVTEGVCERCGKKTWLDHEWVHESKTSLICSACANEIAQDKEAEQ